MVLNALQKKQQFGLQSRQLGLAERRQTFAENQWAEKMIDTKRSRAAIDRMQNFTLANIDQAKAGDLALIDKTNIGRLLTLNARIQEGKKPKSKGKDLELIAAMREQVGPEGDITESQLFQDISIVKGIGKAKPRGKKGTDVIQMRAKIANTLAGNVAVRWDTLSVEQRNKLVDEQMDIITGAEKTKEVKLGNVDTLWEEYQKEKNKK